MNIKEIEKLIHLFEQSKLTSLKVKDKEQTIEMTMEETAVSSVPKKEEAKQTTASVPTSTKEETITAPMVVCSCWFRSDGRYNGLRVGSDESLYGSTC